MPTAAEALGQGPAINTLLTEGIDWISASATLTFSLYQRQVLPLDGFIFWVKSLVTAPMTISGSLHYATQTDQLEDEMAATNTVVFTAESEIENLNAIEPGTMWIADYDGMKIAFSSRGRYYRQADLHHYAGTSLMPALRSQLIESGANIDPTKLVVSNSLPSFLFLNSYIPPYSTPLQLAGMVTMFPSFCIPENLAPPYASVHVERTEPMGSAPWMNKTYDAYELSYDDVRITTYGLDNKQATLLRDTILQWSYDWNVIGIMDFSAIRDEKRPQPEFGILAQKKTMTFRVSYYQSAIRNVARQMLETIIVDYEPRTDVVLDWSGVELDWGAGNSLLWGLMNAN